MICPVVSEQIPSLFAHYRPPYCHVQRDVCAHYCPPPARFNAMQALLLDIMLILPRLMESVISPPTSGWGVDVYTYSQSFIWIFITAWVVYGIFSSLIGQYGRIPFIAEAADQQIR